MSTEYKGAMFTPSMEESEFYQAELAPIGGPDTLLSFTLLDEPISADSVCLFYGVADSAPPQTFDEMLLVYRGIHYRVDVPNRRLYWLGAAPFPLTSSSVLGVVYYGKGKYVA